MNSRNEYVSLGIPDDGDDLEAALRSRSLGGGPADRDQIMYRCGYAAGIASAAKQPARKLAQWQLIGAAASILAVASLAVHFIDERTELSDAPITATTQQTPISSSQAKSDVWLATLTREPVAIANSRKAMTSVRTFTSELVGGNEASFLTGWPDSNVSTLQPSDFTEFLNGDA